MCHFLFCIIHALYICFFRILSHIFFTALSIFLWMLLCQNSCFSSLFTFCLMSSSFPFFISFLNFNLFNYVYVYPLFLLVFFMFVAWLLAYFFLWSFVYSLLRNSLLLPIFFIGWKLFFLYLLSYAFFWTHKPSTPPLLLPIWSSSMLHCILE